MRDHYVMVRMENYKSTMPHVIIHQAHYTILLLLPLYTERQVG